MATVQVKTTDLTKTTEVGDDDFVSLIEPGAGAPKLIKPSDLGGGVSSSQVDANRREIETLELLTSDLNAHTTTPDIEWQNASSIALLGVARVFATNLAKVDANDYTFTTSIAGWGTTTDSSYILVRIKDDIPLASARIRDSYDSSFHTDRLGNTWTTIPAPDNADSGFNYYAAFDVDGTVGQFESQGGIQAQLTSNTNHIGTTTYGGKPTQVEEWALASNANIKVPATKIAGVVPTLKFASMTQTAYDALTSKDSDTIYFLT